MTAPVPGKGCPIRIGLHFNCFPSNILTVLQEKISFISCFFEFINIPRSVSELFLMRMRKKLSADPENPSWLQGQIARPVQLKPLP